MVSLLKTKIILLKHFFTNKHNPSHTFYYFFRLDEDLMVKVSDFGLAKELNETNYVMHDKTKQLPIRWMSVEAMVKGIFTIKSDVVYLFLI